VDWAVIIYELEAEWGGYLNLEAEAMFIRLIIRLFQLVFSARTVFFSHNKSANSVFQPAYQPSRMGPEWIERLRLCDEEESRKGK
jgi:hypothetical protein